MKLFQFPEQATSNRMLLFSCWMWLALVAVLPAACVARIIFYYFEVIVCLKYHKRNFLYG